MPTEIQPGTTTTETIEALMALARGANPVSVPGRLWIAEPVLNGPRTLMLSVLAPDRAGLLSAILDRVCESGSQVALDDGYVKVIEGCASMLLVFRSRDAKRPQVDHLVPVCRALKDEAPGGTQFPPVRVRTLTVRAPDRPDVLPSICRTLATARANIRDLAMQSFTELPNNTDLLHGTGPISGTPITDLKIELELTAETPPDLLARLAPARSGITAKFVD